MRRNQKLGFPGMGASRKVLQREARATRQKLLTVRELGTRVKAGPKLIRSLELKLADLAEGCKALSAWAASEID